VWRESKLIRLLSIIYSRIILDLVCGFSVVGFLRVFVMMISSLEMREESSYIGVGQGEIW